MSGKETSWLKTYLTHTDFENTPTGKDDVRQGLLGFLEVLDSLDRLIKVVDSTESRSKEKVASWADNLRTLRQQIFQAFADAGVTFFDCEGQPFDPNRHQAVKSVQRQDVDDYMVLETWTRGCEWRGSLLREARVVVGRNPAKMLVKEERNDINRY